MLTRQGAVTFSIVLLGAAAVAQMVPVALSAACCEKFLTTLEYYNTADPGVPAYVMGMNGDDFALVPGSSFQLTDSAGTSEDVVFDASQFADMDHATPEEVRDAVNDQLTVGEALVDSGMLMLRGVQGGADAAITLDDGTGGPLAVMGFENGTMTGTKDIELRLATSLDDGMGGVGMEPLPHHPYLVVMSATPGSVQVAGHTLPLGIDATTQTVLRATQLGLLPGFLGELDGNGDALTAFDTSLLPRIFPAGPPEHLYYSFVVFSQDLSSIDYVSNLFQVHVING